MLGFQISVAEARRLDLLLNEAHDLFRPYGLFYADNLLTVGRNVGFLQEPRFFGAVEEADPHAQRRELVWRLHVLCWAAQSSLRVAGDLVECGVLEGLSMSVVARFIDLEATGRGLYLYDLYDIDRPTDGAGPVLAEHAADLAARVTRRFSQFSRAKVVAGFIPDSFSIAVPDQICFLHVDLNNDVAEVAAVRHLWDRLSPGALIVFDDFGWAIHRAQHTALTTLLGSFNVPILELPTGQGLAIKP